jgi:hypothetical protein
MHRQDIRSCSYRCSYGLFRFNLHQRGNVQHLVLLMLSAWNLVCKSEPEVLFNWSYFSMTEECSQVISSNAWWYLCRAGVGLSDGPAHESWFKLLVYWTNQKYIIEFDQKWTLWLHNPHCSGIMITETLPRARPAVTRLEMHGRLGGVSHEEGNKPLTKATTLTIMI